MLPTVRYGRHTLPSDMAWMVLKKGKGWIAHGRNRRKRSQIFSALVKEEKQKKGGVTVIVYEPSCRIDEARSGAAKQLLFNMI